MEATWPNRSESQQTWSLTRCQNLPTCLNLIMTGTLTKTYFWFECDVGGKLCNCNCNQNKTHTHTHVTDHTFRTAHIGLCLENGHPCKSKKKKQPFLMHHAMRDAKHLTTANVNARKMSSMLPTSGLAPQIGKDLHQRTRQRICVLSNENQKSPQCDNEKNPGGHIYRFADHQLCRQRIESCHKTTPPPKSHNDNEESWGGVGSSDLNHCIENMPQENMSKTTIIAWHPSLPPTKYWSKTLLSARLCPAKWKTDKCTIWLWTVPGCTSFLTSDTTSAGKRGWG